MPPGLFIITPPPLTPVASVCGLIPLLSFIKLAGSKINRLLPLRNSLFIQKRGKNERIKKVCFTKEFNCIQESNAFY